MEQLQFIGINPETFQNSLTESFRNELEQIKKDFQPKQPTEFLTRHEVADLLKVDLSTVHNWSKSGKLQRFGIGHRVYYKRAQVESAMQPLKG